MDAGRARVKVYKKHSYENIIHLSRREHQVLDTSTYPTDISRVHVCTENASHFKIGSIFSFKMNTHICVEFPLANTLSECEELFALAKKHQLILHCAFISLLTDHHVALKRLVSTQLNQITNSDNRFSRVWIFANRCGTS